MRLAVTVVCLFFFIFRLEAALSRACPASVPLDTFQLTVKPEKGDPRPARQINLLEKGRKIVYTPAELPPDQDQKKARVSLVLVPDDGKSDLTVTDPVPANAPAEWTTPYRVGVVAIVFGPQGLDHKKVESLVTKDRELVTQLADYAEHTAQVESLIETLTAAEQGSGRNLDAALNGFASRSGTATKIDRTAPTDQQAAALLHALNPAIGAYDPLAATSASRMQQSAGLAASVAALFFGSNVGLAAGGAAMVQNFRTILFPGTDFRSALAQSGANERVTLCAKREPPKSHTRLAYLWAVRVPNTGPPTVTLPTAVHLPLGVKSSITIEAPTAAELNLVPRARDWALVSSDGRSIPVPVTPATENRVLEFDLKKVKIEPGTYRLAAKWDWTTFEARGEVNIHSLADLKTAVVDTESRDRLVEGSGAVPVKLAGPDFEFVDKLTFDKQPVEFKLPTGKRAGPQRTIETMVDTGRIKAGTYHLAMYHPDGAMAEVPVRVLPPNPSITNLPLRSNLGEPKQSLILRGNGLSRVEKIEARNAVIDLGTCSRDGSSREVTVRLEEGAKKGDHLGLAIKVEGVETPLAVADAIEVAGPRPRIDAVNVSIAEDLGVELRDGELPSGLFASVSMRVENAEVAPILHIGCDDRDKTLDAQTLRAGEKRAVARVDAAGPDTLFLSLDAGAIGRAGCNLTAVLETDSAGKSDPKPIGRIVRLPRISAFTLTDEKMGDKAYAGVLTGYDLETIERAGWDAHTGLPVNALPRPVIGERDRQTLRIAVPWPAPAPHAPVYIWLRGETDGRTTHAKY